jgi:hypothetical protein
MRAKRSVLAVALVACSGTLAAPVFAQNGDSTPYSAIAACNRIEKKSARLACYDAQLQEAASRPQAPQQPASEPAPAAPGAAPAAAAAASVGGSAPAAEPTFGGGSRSATAPAAQKGSRRLFGLLGGRSARVPATQTFGSESLPGSRPQRSADLKQITAASAGATDDGIGHWTVTLDSGEQWKMSESAPGFVPPRDGDSVRIRKGTLGSYFMDVNSQAGVRVVRIH